MKYANRPLSREREVSVFINCPFDVKYLALFHATVFTVQDCGFVARSALEINDASEVRVRKILKIIKECQLGIHDLSRTELSPGSKLPRFNMPLELGMFLGAKEYGDAVQRQKRCLVMDREPHRYQRFCSDIAGQDIASHENKVSRLIHVVRNFLRSARPQVMIPGGVRILRRYTLFQSHLPKLCRRLGLRQNELIFNDFATLASEWLKLRP